MSKSNLIFTQPLYDLVELRKPVNPWELQNAAESFYVSIKVVGISKTRIIYDDENGNETIKVGKEISEKVRAVAAFIKILMERWEGPSLERLSNHYGLSMSVKHYLPEELYENNHASSSMKYLTIESFIDNYLK